jgi:hypothetical protein
MNEGTYKPTVQQTTVTFDIGPHPTEKPNYDHIKRECRENSIVRNPCLPRRWKKGKIG